MVLVDWQGQPASESENTLPSVGKFTDSHVHQVQNDAQHHKVSLFVGLEMVTWQAVNFWYVLAPSVCGYMFPCDVTVCLFCLSIKETRPVLADLSQAVNEFMAVLDDQQRGMRRTSSMTIEIKHVKRSQLPPFRC